MNGAASQTDAVQTPALDDTPHMFERWYFTYAHACKGTTIAYVGEPRGKSEGHRGRIDLVFDQGGFELRLSPTCDEARALVALLLKAVGDAS